MFDNIFSPVNRWCCPLEYLSFLVYFSHVTVLFTLQFSSIDLSADNLVESLLCYRSTKFRWNGEWCCDKCFRCISENGFFLWSLYLYRTLFIWLQSMLYTCPHRSDQCCAIQIVHSCSARLSWSLVRSATSIQRSPTSRHPHSTSLYRRQCYLRPSDGWRASGKTSPTWRTLKRRPYWETCLTFSSTTDSSHDLCALSLWPSEDIDYYVLFLFSIGWHWPLLAGFTIVD